MPKPRLTKKQRELVNEIKELNMALTLDPDKIIQEEEPGAWTPRLMLAKDQIIRSEVLLAYVVMDEFLSAVICWHFFGKKRSFQQLWKTRRFETFNYFILEKLYLLQKLELVENVYDIPSWVSRDLRKLNDLRNGIAHSFFPQNRRRKPEWEKEQSVFTKAGFNQFSDDVGKLKDFFVERFWSGSPEEVK